ncbi:flowering time control protein FCA-like isoform X2 [Zingiber officinale]|uniref:flowering time control protein FCA-like isoform X2 n=1 Tax=Zingiber officinale TaxID=94328 RepID=UPI001C4BA0DE|nr:flowering time control protein FCA-like isoform X2 [Zingiber officinale]
MERHRGDRFDDRPGDHFGDGSGRRVPSRWSSDSTTERQPRYPRGGHGGRGEDVFGGNSSSGGRFHPYRAPQDFPPPPPTSGFRDGDAGEFGPSPPVGGPRRGFYGRGGSPERAGGNKIAKLFIGAVPRTATELDIRPLFEEHGDVIEVAFIKDRKTGEQQGCCFVKYATSDEADRAIRALHNRYTLPRGTGPIQVRYADGDRNHPGAADDKLFVASLNKQATAKEIEDIFSPYGRVEDVYIMRDALNQNRGCGFVKFSNREMAAAALNALNGTFVMRGCDQPLVVQFADPKRPRSADQRNGPAFGGPGLSPRSDATLVIRPTANLDEPRNGSKTADSWQSPSPDSFSPDSQSNPYGCGATLQVKGGPIAMTSDPGIYGPTAVSNSGSVSSLSVPPSQQGFNPSMAAVPSFGAQQISPLQKPMIHPRNFPLPLKLQSQQGPASHIHLFNFQGPPQHLGQLQLPQSSGLSSNQDIPSQQLPGLSGQTSSQPLHPQKASSIVLQAPFSLQAQAMPTTANLSQFPASNVTPQMLQQPIQQFPSQVPQMLLQQQAQALQSSFQSSQQAIFQLQQQLQQMQQQQQVSEASKLQSAWGGSQSTSIPPSTAASVPASVITTTVSTLPVAVNASPTVSIPCNWTEHTSPDGFKYYYNNVTQESKWEQPEELILFEQQQQQQELLLLQQQQQQQQQKLSFQLLPAQADPKPHTQVQPTQQVLPAQQVQPQMLRQQYQASGGVQPHMQGISPAQDWTSKNKPAGSLNSHSYIVQLYC